MDLHNESPESPNDPADTHNGSKDDESCVLVEENISIVNLAEDTIRDSELCSESSNELKDDAEELIEDIVDAIPNEFQVIDEVGGSQEIEENENGEKQDELVEEEGEVNGVSFVLNVNRALVTERCFQEKEHEFCAPNSNSTAIDLDVTPIPQPESSRMLIDIKFANRRTYLAFQEEFVEIVKKYYKAKTDDLDIHDDMPNNRIRVSEKLVKKSDAFLVDITPNVKTSEEATPTYRKSFGQTLTGEKEAEGNRKSVTSTPKNSCFNCDNPGHSLRDCPEPRNMRKVNKARNEFNRKELRYHDDNENEYGHLVPGNITDELRAALGLTATQIPMHVYKMRQFGYPSAWIEEAKLFDSGLSLFVEKDKKQLLPGEDDGETDTNNFKYDVQKIYDFPGFNVAPDHPFIDMHRLYGTPPMMPQHSKAEMIRALGDDVVNGYKKIKLREPNTVVDLTDKTSLSVADMEIEDDVEDSLLPLGVTVYTEPPLPSNSSSDKPTEPMEDGELSNESRSQSPNEIELKQQRQALLAEIAESSVFFDTSSINSSVNITAAAQSTFNHSQLESTIIENSENENRDNSAKDSAVASVENERAGHVDATIFGCPVLPSFSGHSILPDGDKFQEGVCDVINFENLAESTGKYEKMKQLIKKVRVFQTEHQKE